MPLISIAFPYNAFLLSKLLMSFGSFDFLKTEMINYKVFGLRAKE